MAIFSLLSLLQHNTMSWWVVMYVISTKDTKLTGINLKLATVRHVCASIVLVSNSFTHDNLLIILDKILVILLASSSFKFSKPFVIVKLLVNISNLSYLKY